MKCMQTVSIWYQMLICQVKMLRKYIALFGFLFAFALLSYQFAVKIVLPQEQETQEPSSVSLLAGRAGLSGEISKGYESGTIYSVDGAAISVNVTGPKKWDKICAAPGYNLLGSFGCGGAIDEWDDVLRSTDREANRVSRTGDIIQMTLHSRAQETAAKLLSEYYPETVCDSAALSVVTRTGAVLAAAGSNLCEPADYFDDTKIDRIHEDFSAVPYQIGSTAKIMTARALLLHENDLPDDWKLSNDRFQDVSFYSPAENVTIHNHDWQKPEMYDRTGTQNENDPLTRLISLFDAMRYSSNTYFLRHILELCGTPQRGYACMDEIYGLSQSIQTEIGSLDAVTCPDDRLYWFFWGQNFECSATRLAALCNHALSGEAYAPFYVTRVYLPDQAHTVIYEANPQPRADLSFPVQKDDLLRQALAECFEHYGIDPAITAPYSEYIKAHRLLSKSGTTDTDLENNIINACRTLSVLDENGGLICTATIIVHNIHNSDADTNTLYSILLDTLNAAGILQTDAADVEVNT